MTKDYQTIIKEIDEHLANSGKQYYSDFYIGITNDIERRLFKEHNVSKNSSWWIYRTANTSDIARNIEKHFLDLGMRGDDGGGNETSKTVYCYAVSPTTID